LPGQLLRVPDGFDPVPDHGDGGVLQDPPLRIHGDDGSARDQEVDGRAFRGAG
jgi:hypothetical protein